MSFFLLLIFHETPWKIMDLLKYWFFTYFFFLAYATHDLWAIRRLDTMWWILNEIRWLNRVPVLFDIDELQFDMKKLICCCWAWSWWWILKIKRKIHVKIIINMMMVPLQIDTLFVFYIERTTLYWAWNRWFFHQLRNKATTWVQ